MKRILLMTILGFVSMKLWAQTPADPPFCEGHWGILIASGPAAPSRSSVELIRDIQKTREIYRELVLNQGEVTSLDRKLSRMGVYDAKDTNALAKDLEDGTRVVLLIHLGPKHLGGNQPTLFLRKPAMTSDRASIECVALNLEPRMEIGTEEVTPGQGMFYLVLTNPEADISWKDVTSLQFITPKTKVFDADTLRYAPR